MLFVIYLVVVMWPFILATSFGLGVGSAEAVYDYYKTDWTNQQRIAESDRNWKRETEYNSPAAQIQRYRDAGLNPALIYGTGTASAGNTHATPANLQAYDIMSPLRRYLTLENMDLNNQIAERTAKNIEAQTSETRARTAQQMRENALMEGTAMSRTDPWYARALGRVGRDAWNYVEPYFGGFKKWAVGESIKR